ncbi:PspC domain-containing protein [Gorillibacterium timonense]|uniref:PspC domain-containing protein n=1 Tax=Gorillibacterium timonense TaxID=1689269 RepID=UPI00071CEEB8|nr:PspC domain-containing protein [Gorillibacterium timonense]
MNKLYRSRRDKKISGLCGGLAEWLNIDATLLRVVVIITAIFSTGFPVILIYIIASAVIPKEPGPYDPPYPPAGSYQERPPFAGGNGGFGGFGGGNGGQAGSPGGNPFGSFNSASRPEPPKAAPQRDQLDEMMKEVEKKALQKEIEELRAKLDKYENDKGDV